MATIVTRSGKGDELSWSDMDNNFSNLNSTKLESANNLSDLGDINTAKSNLGINNVDNTSDATKNSANVTLTNKTIDFTNNTVTATLAQLNTAVTDANIASIAGTETLTNKSISLATNTVTATLAQLNTMVTDADIASLTGIETLSNKTISATSNTIITAASGDLVATTLNAALAELAAEKVQQTSATGSAKLPAGTELQRDGSPSVGAIRFSSTLIGWEGWNGTNWVPIGGGQMYGNALVKGVFYNSQTIAEDVTIATGQNGGTFGPVTINNGFTVTVANGSTWSIV